MNAAHIHNTNKTSRAAAQLRAGTSSVMHKTSQALRYSPLIAQAAAAVLLISAFALPMARAESSSSHLPSSEAVTAHSTTTSQAPSPPPAQAAASAEAAPTAAPSAAETKPPLSKGEIKAQREFKMLDFNRDGKLSRNEVALIPRLAAAFDEADTDKDGYVSYEEVQAFAIKYRAARDKAKAAAAAAQSAPAAPPAPASASPAR